MDYIEARASDVLDWITRGIFAISYLLLAFGLAGSLVIIVSHAFAWQFVAGCVVLGIGGPALLVALCYGLTMYMRVCAWTVELL